MVRDISEQVELRNELQKSHDELEERVEERTRNLKILVNSMAGRENRMADLKEVIRRLRSQIERAGMEPVANDPYLE